MPSVSDSIHGRDEIVRRLSLRTTLPHSAQSINTDDSDEFKRVRCNVRPYSCTSKQKLKWTQELHECFLRAVDHLGGQIKATPKRVVHHMNRSGITIAHVKSHLQMYRHGRIHAYRLSKPSCKLWRDEQCRGQNPWQQVASMNVQDLTLNTTRCEDFPEKLEFEPAAMALIQLKEERGSHFRAVPADLPTHSPGNEALLLHSQQVFEEKLPLQHVETRAFVPVMDKH